MHTCTLLEVEACMQQRVNVVRDQAPALPCEQRALQCHSLTARMNLSYQADSSYTTALTYHLKTQRGDRNIAQYLQSATNNHIRQTRGTQQSAYLRQGQQRTRHLANADDSG